MSYITPISTTFLKNRAVLDSGCTKTVCRASWLDSYIKTLSAKDREKVVEKESSTIFKFGDGETIKS